MLTDRGQSAATLSEGSAGSGADEATKRCTPGRVSPPYAETLHQLDIDLLRPGRYQPRQDFAQASLQELADSICAEGVLQPIVVRPLLSTLPQRYEIIVGERRWRAAQLAGLASIPALVRDVDDRTALAQALVENLQREDLNPVEQARGLQRLVQEFGLTHQEIAVRLGRSRDAVTHLLRILKLDDGVLRQIERGELSLGHAKLLAGQPPSWQRFLARETVREGLSVRALEKRVRALERPAESKNDTPPSTRDADVSRLESRVTELVGAQTRVDFESSTGDGRITFSFHTLDELQGLLERLGYVED